MLSISGFRSRTFFALHFPRAARIVFKAADRRIAIIAFQRTAAATVVRRAACI